MAQPSVRRAATPAGSTSRGASAPPLVTPPRPAQRLGAPRPRLPQRAAVRPPRGAGASCAPIDHIGVCTNPGGGSSGSGEFFPNIRGIKKSPPQLSSSSNRLSKNSLSSAEKTVHQTLDDGLPCEFLKKRNRVNECDQKSSNTNAGPSWSKAQQSRKSSGKRQSKSQGPHVSSQLRSSLLGASAGGEPQASTLGSRYREASESTLFLHFQSMKIMKEDVEEDSASDLSDSERIPIPPSPLSPPDLKLRAEEIDPIDFDLPPGQGHTKPEYHYPDFLPSPFNSWDLRDMALLLNAECRTTDVPRAGGLLGKYIDRLIQLEWLQDQTVQCEKAKAAKARPPAAPGTLGALKSPGRSKLIATALSRPLPYLEGASKSGPSQKKGWHHGEVHPSYYTFETSPRSPDVPSSTRLCSQKQTPETRTEEKKKRSNKSSKLQRWDLPYSDSSPKMETSGNIRIPRQTAMILDSADPCKSSRTPAHAHLKKKGNTNNCGHATVPSEKKLKANGVKQKTCKLK
nr:protein FAM217B [Marmota flaviventris]